MRDGEISIDDPQAADVRALLDAHLMFARSQTPPEDAHAMDVDGLLDPAVTFFSYRAGGALLAIGALKELDAHHAEIKSMHTAQAARARGLGRKMLEHLIAVARARGYDRVSLETGSMASFAPARSLYARAGFNPCEPFGEYRESPNSTYMTLRLKSVLSAPDHRAPAWLEQPAAEGTFDAVGVRVLGLDLEIGVWSPCEGELPLLVAHDGPEYDELAALTRYAGAMIEAGTVVPFRVALVPPGDRDEWYSASATYGRALCNRIVPKLREHVAVAGPTVGMGASLGGLAMLQAQRTWPGAFAGLFLQSGSFFVPRFDRHESGLPRYARIVRFVRRVLRTEAFDEPVPVSMTCGAEEENVYNNRLMANALAAQGYDAHLAEVPDLHNYTSWRDALHPHLTHLLTDLWGPASPASVGPLRPASVPGGGARPAGHGRPAESAPRMPRASAAPGSRLQT